MSFRHSTILIVRRCAKRRTLNAKMRRLIALLGINIALPQYGLWGKLCDLSREFEPGVALPMLARFGGQAGEGP